MATGTTFFLLNRFEPPPAPALGGAVELAGAMAGDDAAEGSAASGCNDSDSASATRLTAPSDGMSFAADADDDDDGGSGGGLGAGGVAFALAAFNPDSSMLWFCRLSSFSFNGSRTVIFRIVVRGPSPSEDMAAADSPPL